MVEKDRARGGVHGPFRSVGVWVLEFHDWVVSGVRVKRPVCGVVTVFKDLKGGFKLLEFKKGLRRSTYKPCTSPLHSSQRPQN